jgi:diaminopimelate decarboxylase
LLRIHKPAIIATYPEVYKDADMNRYLTYQEGELLFEDVALSEIAQEMYTPFYVYSKAAILEKIEAIKQAFIDIKPLLAFSMKALDTTLILKLVLEKGCSLTVENGNEIQRALGSGFQPTSLILNSHGLPDYELVSILKQKPLIINVSSVFELEPLNRLATELDIGVRIGLRVNLGIETPSWFGSKTCASDHRAGIAKEDIDQAVAMVSKYPQLNLVGLACSLGCQVTQLAPWVKLSEEMAKLYKEVSGMGFNIEYLDLGAGFPVDYGEGDFLEIKKIARNIVPHVKDLDCRLILEPGRYFTAEAGVLVTSVVGYKTSGSKTYVICDAGFSEFPYAAIFHHNNEIIPVKEPPAPGEQKTGAFAIEGTGQEPVDVSSDAGMADRSVTLYQMQPPSDTIASHEYTEGELPESHIPGKPITADIVGPGGEDFDYLTLGAKIMPPKRGDLLALLNVGAYGRSLSGNFASRSRPPEILIERDKFEMIRSRELIDDLVACDFEESQIDQ